VNGMSVVPMRGEIILVRMMNTIRRSGVWSVNACERRKAGGPLRGCPSPVERAAASAAGRAQNLFYPRNRSVDPIRVCGPFAADLRMKSCRRTQICVAVCRSNVPAWLMHAPRSAASIA